MESSTEDIISFQPIELIFLKLVYRKVASSNPTSNTGVEVWGGASKQILKPIEKMQNQCLNVYVCSKSETITFGSPLIQGTASG